MNKKPTPMRFCFNCGEKMGAYLDYDRFDTCGQIECQIAERNARREESDEREAAHRQLDRDMGW